MMCNLASFPVKPSVHVGLHGRIHIAFGQHGPTLVATREEMAAFAQAILAATGKVEPFIEGDVQHCNDDIHPRAVTA
jgi:hypothetical protein